LVIIGTAYCIFVYGLLKRIGLVFKITRVFILFLFGYDLLIFYANWPPITLYEISVYATDFVLYSAILYCLYRPSVKAYFRKPTAIQNADEN
jgi:hypothetical protein